MSDTEMLQDLRVEVMRIATTQLELKYKADERHNSLMSEIKEIKESVGCITNPNWRSKLADRSTVGVTAGGVVGGVIMVGKALGWF